MGSTKNNRIQQQRQIKKTKGEPPEVQEQKREAKNNDKNDK